MEQDFCWDQNKMAKSKMAKSKMAESKMTESKMASSDPNFFWAQIFS